MQKEIEAIKKELALVEKHLLHVENRWVEMNRRKNYNRLCPTHSWLIQRQAFLKSMMHK